MATFTWKVLQMVCYPELDSQTNVVFFVGWVCYGEQVEGETTYEGEITMNTPIEYVPGGSYTPYDQLTQEQVLSWIWNTVNKTEVEAAVQEQINNKINPPAISPALPWPTQG